MVVSFNEDATMIDILKHCLNDKPDWHDIAIGAALIGASVNISSAVEYAGLWLVALGTVCLLQAWHGGRKA